MSAPLTETDWTGLRRYAERDIAGEQGALDDLGEDVIRLLDERDALTAELERLRSERLK